MFFTIYLTWSLKQPMEDQGGKSAASAVKVNKVVNFSYLSPNSSVIWRGRFNSNTLSRTERILFSFVFAVEQRKDKDPKRKKLQMLYKQGQKERHSSWIKSRLGRGGRELQNGYLNVKPGFGKKERKQLKMFCFLLPLNDSRMEK